MPEKLKTIILYGGSFDPPHLGHASLAKAAFNQVKPDLFYFIPNYRTPFKEINPVSFEDRINMINLMMGADFMSMPQVKISNYEEDRKEVVHTWKTVKHFKRIYKNSNIYFLMGSDCLQTFKKWQHWEYILKKTKLLVGVRPGFNIVGHEAPFVPLKGIFPEAASNGIRVNIILDKKIAGIDKSILEYIQKRGLYFSREKQMLKNELSPKRYTHSVNVARMAVSIAAQCGVSKHKAAVAGILHDCAREIPVDEIMSMKLTGPVLGKYRKETILNAPKLLHAPAGAKLAKMKYGVGDKEILRAIHLHPTGATKMSVLDKIIYVSDYLSAERKFENLNSLRELAIKDFEKAFIEVVKCKNFYRKQNNFWAHPLSDKLCKYITRHTK